MTREFPTESTCPLRNARLSSLLVLLSLLASTAAAHEFWIEPGSFATEVGAAVDVRLFVGDGFDNGRPYARNPRHLKSFFVDAGERRLVPGVAGGEPAGRLSAEAGGALLIGYESHSSTITLEAQRFEAYLRDEGLDHVIEQRLARGESELAGREGFSRAAKSLLRVAGLPGDPRSAAGASQLLGLRVEIVPETDPSSLGPAEPLMVRVLRRGQPLEDTQVRLFLRGHPEATLDTRTDAEGRASLPLGREGIWLISVVHMERAPAGDSVDWLSTWSSLTFSTHQPAPALQAGAALPTLEEENAE